MFSHIILAYSLLESGEKRRLSIIAILTVVNSMLEVFGVALVLPFIALVNDVESIQRHALLAQAYEFLEVSSANAFIVICGLAFAILIVTKNILFLVGIDAQNAFALGRAAKRSIDMLSRTIGQPVTELRKMNSTEHQDTVNHFVDSFYTSVLLNYINVTMELLVIAGILGVLIFAQPVVTLAVGGVFGTTMGLLHWWHHRWFGRFGPINNRLYTARHTTTRQIFDTIKEIKVLGCEEFFIQRFATLREQNASWMRRANDLQQLPKVAIESLVVVGIVALVIGAIILGKDRQEITATLGLFAVAAFRLMPSLTRLLMALSNIRQGEDATHRIARVLSISSPVRRSKAVDRMPFNDVIEIDGVGFRYGENHKFGLKEISLVIKKGESIGLIGPTGSGKSTLMDILLGLLHYDSGNIRVDGVSISSNLPAWQANIGYVPQSIALIDDSIRRNVAFGLPDESIDDNQVWEALKLAQMDDVVRSFPGGLDTGVGENGVSLSGGQRQRVGLARALYRDAPILCMDEATSALDAETEHRITESLSALQGQKTMIIIAHRLSTLKGCDRLIMMEGGAIKAQGRFSELSINQPDFRRALELSNFSSMSNDLS